MVTPRVSIHLPVFNGARSLQRQLDSIIGQTYTDFWLFLNDNGSTDGTESICRSYLGDSRVIYHRSPVNLGFGANFGKGFNQCLDSEFMIYASSNDFWEPTYLEKCVKALDDNPKAPLAYSYCWLWPRTNEVQASGRGNSGEVSEGEIQNAGLDSGVRTPEKELYYDEFDLSALSGPQRYLTVTGELNLCTPFYGLMRVQKVLEYEIFFHISGQAAAGDNAFLGALAADGPFVQIKEPLFNREAAEHFGRSLSERRVHQENLNNHRSYVPGFPFVRQTYGAAFASLWRFDFPPEITERFFPLVHKVCLARFQALMEEEVSLAVSNLLKGNLHMGFSGEKAFDCGAYPHIDVLTIYNLLVDLNLANHLLPKEAQVGVHMGRAVCLIMLNRRQEAALALKEEIALGPLGAFYRPAFELEAALKKSFLQGQG
ncbi:MAG: glycosyltransferase family 2 protein [Candidatus Adiutrix sp.]